MSEDSVMADKNKMINDPVHGMINIPSGIVFKVLEHPVLQRLRGIKQLGLSHIVYPGVTHTRFLHTIGAMHLAQLAVKTLRNKDCEITKEEEEGLYCAILLHDSGHAPFSHSLEYTLLNNLSHEKISECIILRLIDELNHPSLKIAHQIFVDKYPKKFLHKLLSGELDVDRLDYLRRDSFFSGVVEGTVGIERIIQMLVIWNDRLVVEEKGLYSIEKFLIARRLMYWQVYLHKTVVVAEFLLQSIIKRVRFLLQANIVVGMSEPLHYFLTASIHSMEEEALNYYLRLEDADIETAIKSWCSHQDTILSTLCKQLIYRKLLSITIQDSPFVEEDKEIILQKIATKYQCSLEEADYFYGENTIQNNTYAPLGEEILLLTKNKEVVGINSVSDLIGNPQFRTIKTKYYRVYPKNVV